MSEYIGYNNCGIYCWTNKVNGKKYIGQAVNLKVRKRKFLNWNNPKYAGDYINQARIKYNSNEYWNYEILEFCNKEDLNEKETYYISYFKSNLKEFGYNLTEGGGGTFGYVLSEETKRKMSIANSGEKNGFYGKHHSEETKRFLSEMRIGKYNGEDNGFYGKHHSEESKRKMSNARKKRIITEETKRKLSIINSGENNGMYGRNHSEETKRRLSKLRSIPILQYDLNMNLIREWESAKSVMNELGFNNSRIGRNCKGIISKAYGYIWRYKN